MNTRTSDQDTSETVDHAGVSEAADAATSTDPRHDRGESAGLTHESHDLRALRAQLASRAHESRTLKLALSAPWTRPMAEEQRQLVRLRRRITGLCILRAFLRGRFHLVKALREGAFPDMKWDRERWHAEVAERVARELREVGSNDPGPDLHPTPRTSTPSLTISGAA